MRGLAVALPLFSTIALAAVPNARQCTTSVYPVSLNGYKYKGLRVIAKAHTLAACRQACCDDKKCNMYQFKNEEFSANVCEIGAPAPGSTSFEWAPGWLGRGHHMTAPSHAAPEFHSTVGCDWNCYKKRYPALDTQCKTTGWPCTHLQLKGHFLQYGTKKSWNCHCEGYKPPKSSAATSFFGKKKPFNFHIPNWAHLAKGKKFYGQHCEKHSECIASGYCSIKKLHVKECLPCSECKSHQHAVDGMCPASCKTYMDGLKKKMEEAKQRIAKMKDLAASHKKLSDKKVAHIAKRSATPMEESAYASLHTCKVHKDCPLTAFCEKLVPGAAPSASSHCLPCIHCVADTDAIDGKCPAYCTKMCTKHTDCPTNGFCFGIAPHRCMACETCVADVMAIDHHCPAACESLNQKRTELEIEIKDYFGDYDASIEDLLEKQEKKAKVEEGEALEKLNKWKGKYNEIQHKSMRFESEEKKFEYEESKLKAEEKKLAADEEEWKEYEKSMQAHRDIKSKLQKEEEAYDREREGNEARQAAIALISVLSTCCCMGIICFSLRHKLKEHITEGIDQVKRAAAERDAQQYARMNGNQVEMEMDRFSSEQQDDFGPEMDAVDRSDL